MFNFELENAQEIVAGDDSSAVCRVVKLVSDDVVYKIDFVVLHNPALLSVGVVGVASVRGQSRVSCVGIMGGRPINTDVVTLILK